MIVLDEFEFLVKDSELAISLDCPSNAIKRLVWDCKNVIILEFTDGNKFALINILPNIRDLLRNAKSVLVIFNQNNEIVDAYDVELIKNDAMGYDDLFEAGAISCCKKFEELKEKIKKQQ